MTNLSAFQSSAQSLDTEQFIDLITITTVNTSNNQLVDFRICNFLDATFGGLFYQKVPCKVAGFSKSGEDTEPRSSLTISDVALGNLLSLMGSVIDETYVVGSKVNIKRTQPRFLDGRPTSDPNQFFEFELRINGYQGEYMNQFVFNLVPYHSLERKKLPSRMYSRRCQWQLNSIDTPDPNCAAPLDKAFDINNNVISPSDPQILNKRACKKDLTACKLYHGHTLRFGGFPSVARSRN
jgi:lambda family phage minor tail protein L